MQGIRWILPFLVISVCALNKIQAACPAAGSTIAKNTTVTVTSADSPCSINGLIIKGNLVVEDGAVLTVSGDFDINGSGNVTIDNGGELSIAGDGNVTGNGDLIINGVLTVEDGGNLQQSGGGTTSGAGIILVEGNGTVDPDIITDIGGESGCSMSGGCCGDPDQCDIAQPVTLSSFQSKSYDNSVVLTWATESEEAFDYFNIEKSLNGADYHSIGNLKGAGDSNARLNYQFIDDNPYYGRSYYRLTAIDLDGSYEIFRAITANHVPNHLAVNIYPNPIQNNRLNVNFGLPIDSNNKSISVYNLSGKIIEQYNLQLNNEFIELDLSMGIYLLKIQIDNYILTKRLIVK